MDERGTVDWLENVWNKRPGAMLKKLSGDMFRAHLTDDVKRVAAKKMRKLAVIPSG